MINVKIKLWLEEIIYQRFGCNFNLIYSNNKIEMRSGNSRRVISFSLCPSLYQRGNLDMPCSLWDPEDEGWHSILEKPIHAPAVQSLLSPLIDLTRFGYHINYDILGLTYWMLTRQEEVDRTDLDIHGRFPATSSHAFKFGYLNTPLVDEWLHILKQIINKTWPELNLKINKFKIQISHDVDRPSLYAFRSWREILRMMGGHLLKRNDLRAFILTPYIKLFSKKQIHSLDPFNTFEWIMDQSDKEGLTSIFYFLCNNEGGYDADYNLNDPRITKLIKKISSRGHKIGLHPSYNAFNNTNLIKNEFDKLVNVCNSLNVKQNAWGSRMHYLKWEQSVTPRALVQAGLNFDATLGYADHPGFRCGTCFEYPAFDPVNLEYLPMSIRPLILMDSTLLDSTYFGMGASKDAFEIAINLRETCRKVNGCFELLWHNSNLHSDSQKLIYSKILANE